jgi:hypothetical protein
MTFHDDRIVWQIPGLDPYVFDRGQYETEIAALADRPSTVYRPTDLNPLGDAE